MTAVPIRSGLVRSAADIERDLAEARRPARPRLTVVKPPPPRKPRVKKYHHPRDLDHAHITATLAAHPELVGTPTAALVETLRDWAVM